jgi:hypothetical protein
VIVLGALLAVFIVEIAPVLESWQQAGPGSGDHPEKLRAPDGSLIAALEDVQDSTPADDLDDSYYALLEGVTRLKSEDLRKLARHVDDLEFYRQPSKLRAKVVRITALLEKSEPLALDRSTGGVDLVHRIYLRDASGDQGFVVDLIDPPPPIESRTLVDTEALFLKICKHEGENGAVQEPLLLGRQARARIVSPSVPEARQQPGPSAVVRPEDLKAPDESLLAALEKVQDSTPVDELDDSYYAVLESLTRLKSEDLQNPARRIGDAQFYRQPSKLRARVVRIAALFEKSEFLALDRTVGGVGFVHRTYLVDTSGDQGFVVDLMDPPPAIESRTLVDTEALFFKIGTFESRKGEIRPTPFLLGRQVRVSAVQPAASSLESEHLTLAAALVVALALLLVTLVIVFQSHAARRGATSLTRPPLPPLRRPSAHAPTLRAPGGAGEAASPTGVSAPGAAAASSERPQTPPRLRRRHSHDADVAPPLSRSQLRYLRILIAACVLVLVGRIGWNLYKKYLAPPSFDAPKELAQALDGAGAAAAEVFAVESKAWLKDQNLGPEDLDAIRSSKERIENGVVRAQSIIEHVRLQRDGASLDAASLEAAVRSLLALKLRIADADSVLGSKDPAEPGGFFIPFHKAAARSRSAQDEIAAREQALGTTPAEGKEAAIDRTAAAEKARDADRVLAEAEASFTRLEAYVKDELALQDLTPKDLSELELLAGELRMAGDARRRAAKLRE